MNCANVAAIEAPTSGSLVFDGTDLASVRNTADRLAFMHKVQPIFQNPFEAFNPLKQLDRYLFMTRRRFLAAGDQTALDIAVDAALHQVGLSLKEVRHRYPHELSGGQLQRVAIARALLSNPKLIVADEPVSMVDASLRMSIVNLFKALRDDFGISIIYVTHDLATAYTISDRIIIMRKGSVVESGDARTVLNVGAGTGSDSTPDGRGGRDRGPLPRRWGHRAGGTAHIAPTPAGRQRR